jgi:hypothetical protein
MGLVIINEIGLKHKSPTRTRALIETDCINSVKVVSTLLRFNNIQIVGDIN